MSLIPACTGVARLACRGALLMLLLLAACLTVARAAEPLRLDAQALPLPLGPHAQYLREPGAALDWVAAQQAHARGEFRADARPVAGFGIGAAPVWAVLEMDNPSAGPLTRELGAGMTWIDRIDAYLVQDGRTVASWHTGDALANAPGLVPAQGYVWNLQVPPGRSALFVRAQTEDPLVLPLALQTPEAALAGQRDLHYGYGMLYGFLLACVAISLVLFTTLRTRVSLYYSVYLLSFIVMNMAYTGHCLAWWWPEWPAVQRYAVLVSMVLFSCCGFRFATRFLDLADHVPRVQRVVDGVSLAALALMGACILVGSQRGAAYVAFSFLMLFTIGMVSLGVVGLRTAPAAGRYFLAAAVCGMTGAASSTLSTWGFLPMNALTFRGVEIGVVLEALLLGLALALRAREQDDARKHAEQQARTDALTGLPNRRAFLEQAEQAWAVTQRRSRPLSVLMLDIDHFKAINDRHGHEAGDQVLVQAARVIALNCRAGDMAARWGGEEFVVLMPDAESGPALALAERLRTAFAETRVHYKGEILLCTASLGVTERQAHASLAELLAEADRWLYRAKNAGRNRVAGGAGASADEVVEQLAR